MKVVDRTQKASSRSPSGQAARDQRHALYNSGVRNGLWAPKHERRLGKAVWFFGWLIGKQTNQDGTTGMVLGGKVLTWAWVAQETGWTVRTLQRWGQVLRSQGYIDIDLERRGFTVKIQNAKKFMPWQESLFPGSPQVARVATSGEAQSGEPHTKGGGPGSSYYSMKYRGGNKLGTRLKKARSSAASLAGDFQKVAVENWTLRYEGGKPTWGAAEFTLLAKIANTHQELGLETLIQVWGNFLASSDRFLTDRGHSPKDFWSRFDRLRQGPILERGGKREEHKAGKANGSGADPRLERFRKLGQTAKQFAERARGMARKN